jgi:hypothetical protein
MSPQAKFLAGKVELARAGDEQAAKFVRDMCQRLTEHAPLEDLLSIGEFFVRLGTEVGFREASRN